MIAAKTAFTTNAAGPSLQNFSKMDSIAHSITHVGLALCPLLIGRIPCHVLASCHSEFQSAAVRLRSEPSDLIDLREVLRASCEERHSTPVPGKALRAPVSPRENVHSRGR